MSALAFCLFEHSPSRMLLISLRSGSLASDGEEEDKELRLRELRHCVNVVNSKPVTLGTVDGVKPDLVSSVS
jgi:hypothetical protein